MAARVKAMEMQVGRRPVYGGAPQHPPKIAANVTTRGLVSGLVFTPIRPGPPLTGRGPSCISMAFTIAAGAPPHP